jgi:cell division protein FtsL
MPRAATAAARSGAQVQPAPRRPRQRPRPARRKSGAVPRARSLPAAPRLRQAPRRRWALAATGSVVLDRVLRGRAWVALIGTLLVGIVFFNVSVMRLDENITRTSERATTLKQANARLLLQAAKLGSSERIQRAAARRGLVLPAPGQVRYLKLSPRIDARRAAKRIRPPQPVPAPAAVPQTQTAPGTSTAPFTSTPPAQTAPGSQQGTTQTGAPQQTAQAPTAQAAPTGGATAQPTGGAGP